MKREKRHGLPHELTALFDRIELNLAAVRAYEIPGNSAEENPTTLKKMVAFMRTRKPGARIVFASKLDNKVILQEAEQTIFLDVGFRKTDLQRALGKHEGMSCPVIITSAVGEEDELFYEIVSDALKTWKAKS